MSVVSLLDVKVLNNPAKFTDKYSLEIVFECLESLTKDLEWKLTYVGSANSSDHDQELDVLLVGPVPLGVHRFCFEAEPPNVSKIPSSEILGVTVVMLACFYDTREFVRVGYYVSNEYDSPELQNEPPKQPLIDRIVRNMLTEKPRVTRFAIKWDSEESAPPEFPPDQPEADEAEDDGELYGAEEAAIEAAIEAAEEALDESSEVVETVENVMDVEMGGAEESAGPSTEKIDEGAESEDLEAESSGESDEEDEAEVEAEGEDDVEMGDQDMEDAAAAPPTKQSEL